jgi:hypothetical protein
MPPVSAEAEEGDAFGRALLDRLGGGDGSAGGGGAIVCERDDGFVDADGSDYLSGWDRRDAWAADRSVGRVLDVGAGGAVLGPAGVIVGTCLDPYQTSEETHLAYHRRNRERGRMPGQITMRIRYQRLATAWFGLLWMSPDELTGLVSRHGWQVAEVLPGALYGVTLTRR